MATRMKTDEGIAKDVVDSLYWDSRVDASKVGVTVEEGIVNLAGTVSSYAERAAATEDAWVITGVRDVRTQLKVELQTGGLSDSEIKTNIERAFTSGNDLYPFDIRIRVESGEVTLAGTVDAFWKKVSAEGMALSMRGVTGVTNKLAVVPTQTIADENIAESIIHALERNVHVTVEDMTVTVENGTVILNGTVPSGFAKRAAYDAARYTAGVKEVKDLIVIRIPVEGQQG